jgi:hypothetical protein
MAVSGTGNKQYDNPPNNVGGAILTGLLLHRLSDDPLVQAEGLAMARRAAYWWTLARTGPLQVGDYYKGMFWTTAWAGFGLAELTATDPNGPWKEWSAELAQSFRQAQLPSGAWTWVEEGSGKKGTSNERNDRSKDNRQLNCGDVLLAMSRLAKASGTDIGDAQRKADTFLSKTMTSPPEWFYRDRRPGNTPEPLGTVCYLQWLVEQPKTDAKSIARVRKLIDERFVDTETGLLRGYMPRWSPRDSDRHLDLSASARYAHALAVLAARGDAAARDQAERLIETILAKASPESGLIDYLGRSLPADPRSLGADDAHAYLCMKAAISWEVLDALEADRTLRERVSRATQTIDCAPVANKQPDDPPFLLQAQVSSGLPVRFEVLSGPAKIDGQRVVLRGEAGVVRIAARQDGNQTFKPAAPIEQAFAVGKAYPNPPSDLTAAPLATDTIRLGWKDHAEDETGYRVEMSGDGKKWRVVAELEAGSTGFDVTDLKPGERLQFRVLAFNRVLDSPASNTAEAQTYEKAMRVELEAEDGGRGGDWKLKEDESSSGGKCVEAGATSREGMPAGQQNRLFLSLPFETEVPGQVTIHYRSWGNSGANDSQFLRVDDQPWRVIFTGNTGQWQWGSTVVEIDQPGKHVLQFGCREATGRIDRVIVTNGAISPR